MTIEDVTKWIENDATLEDVEKIYDSLKTRRRHLTKFTQLNLRRGQIVEFNSLARPLYLMGARARVHRINGSRVDVKLDQQINRYQAGSIISCSPDVLARVKKSRR